jgi:hypothetical protein
MLARTFIGAAALAAVSLAVPDARAADPVPLGKAEVQQLVTGKVLTVQFVDPLRLTLAKDGKVEAFGTASAIRAIGTWNVDDQGRLCMQSPNPVLAGCRSVLRSDRGLGMTKTDGTGFFAISDIQ